MKFLHLLIIITELLGFNVYATDENTKTLWETTTNTTTDLWNESKKTVDNLVDTWMAKEDVNQQLPEIWQEITPKLDKLLVLEEQHEQLPDEAWFGLDKKKNQVSIEQLLDESILILSNSPNNEIKWQIQLLDEKIATSKAKIDEYRREQISAPMQSPWKMTVDDYKNKIKETQREVEKYESEIKQHKIKFNMSLAEMGLQLTPEQIDLLFTSVVGDDLIQSNVIYNNIKQISEKLVELAKSSGEDLDISKRYYGLHTILLEILLHMQQNFINNINLQYLPKIDNIVTEINNVAVVTRNLQEQIRDETHLQYLKANLAAQELTLNTAKLYREHLLTQRSKIEVARSQTMDALQVAQNTYKTVKLSGELLSLLRTNQKTFDILLSIQMPTLLIFENLQMKQEFAALTAQLKDK